MHPGLAAARKKIDALDARIAALLARRFALASGLGAFKEKVTDRARERAVLAAAAKAAGREYAADVRGEAVDCGHFLPEEAPGATAALLREFLLPRADPVGGVTA